MSLHAARVHEYVLSCSRACPDSLSSQRQRCFLPGKLASLRALRVADSCSDDTLSWDSPDGIFQAGGATVELIRIAPKGLSQRQGQENSKFPHVCTFAACAMSPTCLCNCDVRHMPSLTLYLSCTCCASILILFAPWHLCVYTFAARSIA